MGATAYCLMAPRRGGRCRMDVWEVPYSSCPGLDRGSLMDAGPTRATRGLPFSYGAAAAWSAIDNYVRFAGEPPYDYNYGSDFVCEDNTVYVGAQSAGTPQQYARQATALTEQGQA